MNWFFLVLVLLVIRDRYGNRAKRPSNNFFCREEAQKTQKGTWQMFFFFAPCVPSCGYF
jgi:hypothetical protein